MQGRNGHSWGRKTSRLRKAGRNTGHFKSPVDAGDIKFIEKQTYPACDSSNDQASGVQRWSRQIIGLTYSGDFAGWAQPKGKRINVCSISDREK